MNTHALSISLGTRTDLTWAQETVTRDHYLHQPVDPRARPMVYVVNYAAPGLGTVEVRAFWTGQVWRDVATYAVLRDVEWRRED